MKFSSLLLLYLFVAGVVPAVANNLTDTIRIQRLDSVKVAVARVSESITSVTPIHAIDDADMNRLNMVDLTDGLNRIAGVFMRDYGGAGGMKTVSVRGLGANHTAVSLDGIVQTDVQTGQIDFSRYNLMNISQMKMVVADDFDGLQSARAAGSSSMVELYTALKSCSTKASFRELSIEQGSFNRYGIQLLWQRRITKKWTLQAAGHYLYVGNNYPYVLTNGMEKEKKHRHNNKVNTYRTDVVSLWRISGNASLDLKGHWYDNYFRLPGQVIYYNPYNNERQHNRQFWANATWSQRLSPKWMLKVRGKWEWNESKYKDIDGIYPNGVWTESYWQREGYLSGVVRYDASRWLRMSYALDYVRNDLNSNQFLNNDVSREGLLQSLTANMKWSRLTVSARCLYSLYGNHAEGVVSARDCGRFNASASMSWRMLPNEHLYLRAFYKNIFRLPTFTESYYYHLGNADLSPERTSQYGAGLTMQREITPWWRVLRMSVDGYFNWIDDKITSIPLNLHQWRTINIGKVNACGCDVSMESHWLINTRHGIILNGSASWQKVTDMTRKGSLTYKRQLAYMPAFTGFVSLAYENPVVNMAFSIKGCSSRWSTHEHSPSTRLPGYAEISASLWRTVILCGNFSADVKLSVQNIADKNYGVIKGYPMPGRAYRLGVTMKF